MNPLDEKSLKQMRVDAGLSQADLALNVGIDQGTVSRYEMDEDSIPRGVFRRWQEVCGERQQPGVPIFPIGEPYALFDQRLGFLQDYLSAPPDDHSTIFNAFNPLAEGAPTFNRLSERPLVAVVGRFDAGKSHFINYLLGQSVAPVRYQPTTAIPAIFRHATQRPQWLTDSVMVLRMTEGFNPDNWANEEHCRSYLVKTGQVELLNSWGTYGTHEERDELIAMVFIDSPVLKACSLIDSPGFGNKDREAQDARAINFALSRADSFFYLSPLISCFDTSDRLHFPSILTRLGIHEDPVKALTNVTFVVTHAANHITNAQVSDVVEQVAKSLSKHLGAQIPDQASAENLSAPTLKTMICPFWSESVERSTPLMRRFTKQMTEILPELRWKAADSFLTRLKAESNAQLAAKIESYERMLEDWSAAAKRVEAIRAAEPQRKSIREAKRREVLADIFRYNNESAQCAADVYEEEIDAEHIAKIIKHTYDKSKDAQKGLGPLLFQRMQSKISADLKNKGEALKTKVDDFLAEYRFQTAGKFVVEEGTPFEIPFDSQGVFAAGISACATLGMLAVWASMAGNLGGYILIANLMGFLSSLGIATGSAATIMSGVAAIGGPITLAIGLAIAVGIFAYLLFGESWQNRLARKVEKLFREHQAHKSLLAWVQSVWDDTRKAFEAGADHVEATFEAELRKQEELVKSNSRHDAEELIGRCEEWKSFFAGMPVFSQPAMPIEDMASHKPESSLVSSV